MGNILKQAQQMGGRLKELNEQMKGERVKGSSGGGMVEVEMNGKGVKVTHQQEGNRLTLTFADKVTVNRGNALQVVLKV